MGGRAENADPGGGGRRGEGRGGLRRHKTVLPGAGQQTQLNHLDKRDEGFQRALSRRGENGFRCLTPPLLDARNPLCHDLLLKDKRQPQGGAKPCRSQLSILVDTC